MAPSRRFAQGIPPVVQVLLCHLGAWLLRFRDPDAMVEQILEIGGMKVRSRSEGRGPPLFFFYDQWHTSAGLDSLVTKLQYRFRVYTVDPPGFGGSPLPNDYPLTPKDYARFLGEALATVGGGRIILVLQDLGLPIGLEGFREGLISPDKIEAVILMNGLVFEEQKGGVFSSRPSHFLKGRDLPTDRMAHRRRLIKCYGDPDSLDEGLAQAAWDSYIQGYLRSHVKLGNAIEESIVHTKDRLQALASTGIPVLILWGEDDVLGGKEVAARLGELLPEAEGFLLPGVGHFPQVEAPDEVAQEISAFVERKKPGASPSASGHPAESS